MADIMTPALGESVTEATVARWTKKAGDAVRRDEVLVELETDKVSLEVVAPEDGVLSEIGAAEGDTVTPGTVLGRVTAGGATRQVAAAQAGPVAKAAARSRTRGPRPPKRPRPRLCSPRIVRSVHGAAPALGRRTAARAVGPAYRGGEQARPGRRSRLR